MTRPRDRQRLLLGMPVGFQAVAVTLSVLLLSGLITMAVLAWLERTS